MQPRRPRNVGTPRSRPADCQTCGVFRAQESAHRRRDETVARSWCPRGNRAAWMPSRVRICSRGELEHEHSDGGDERARDHPRASRVQAAMVRLPPRAGSVQRVNRPRVVRVGLRASAAGRRSCVLLGLEGAQDVIGGGRASNRLGCLSSVEVLVGLQLGERRAVDGEVVGEAERERREVLVRHVGCGRGGCGPAGLALLAAAASVLERPRPVGALGDWSVPSSAVVSHHRHPNMELYHHDLALDWSGDG